MHKQVPNTLTMFRMLIVPFFAYVLFKQPYNNSIAIALGLFVLGSFTDYLDGAIARKYNLTSDFGKIMDPLADKLLVLTAIAALTWMEPYRLPQAIFYIILIREVGITLLREVFKKRKLIMPADNLGKLKTVLQMTGIIIALWYWGICCNVLTVQRTVILYWFWAVAAITLYSGLNYFVRFMRSKEQP